MAEIDSYSISIPTCHTITYEGHCFYFYVRGFLPCHDYLLFVVIIMCLSKYIISCSDWILNLKSNIYFTSISLKDVRSLLAICRALAQTTQK